MGHALDYLTGDIGQMGTRVAAVLPAWSNDLPGHHAVLAMQAFSEAECGRYAQALDRGHQALEINPWDARAHHALTHVYEMTGQPLAGHPQPTQVRADLKDSKSSSTPAAIAVRCRRSRAVAGNAAAVAYAERA
jgi:hypothetical protein